MVVRYYRKEKKHCIYMVIKIDGPTEGRLASMLQMVTVRFLAPPEFIWTNL